MITKDTEFIILTNHAKKRAWERFGINEESLIQTCLEAIMFGYSLQDAPTKAHKKYIESKVHRDKDRSVYCTKSHLMVFTKDFILITIYRLPPNLVDF